MSTRDRALLVGVGILVLLFAKPLYDLARFGLKEELHSHVFLIPIISGYLIRVRLRELQGQVPEGGGGRALAVVLGTIGFLLASSVGLAVARGWDPALSNYLCLITLAFVFLLNGVLAWSLGATFMRTHAFALSFLAFLAPMPVPVEYGLEYFFQHASAEASAWFFALTGTPTIHDGLLFKLPRLEIIVAQECSGIRSSFVLFITSLLAGHLFLHSRWRRLFLCVFVVPLGVARNAFRIVTISLLTIHVDPGIINGPLHKRGGPIFFALSLIPFFLVLRWLRRSDAATSPSSPKPT